MSPGTVAMEDGKPPCSSLLDNGDTMQIRLTDICERLDLHESLISQATALFREIKPTLLANMSSVGGGSPEEVERIWFAYVLYCVTKLGQSNQGGRIKLFQILRAASLNAVDFFKEMPHFMLKAGRSLSGMYDADWETRLELTELHASIIQLNQLSRFYKRAYQQFFLMSDDVSGQSSATSSSTHDVSDFHRFGWLLFLSLRIHAFSRFKDLVTCTNGLVSILAVLILHVPKRFRSFSFDDSSIFVKNSDKGVNLLASLCHVYNTSEDDLRRALESVNKLIEGILKKKAQCASECSAENLDCINTDGLTYFDGLLDGSLESNVLILEKDYDNSIDTKGELDERIFVTDEDSLLVSGSLSGWASNICGIQLDALASPAKTITSPCLVHSASSPVNGNIAGKSKMVASTPVSAAMTTAKWLRTVISPLPSKPSVELESFFSLCDGDVASLVARRANIILEAIFPSNSFGERCISGALQTANIKDNTWAEERKSEALKLYYRVLGSICRAESKMQNRNNLPSLLSNERFHRCMLACSAELVLATHHTVIMIFPAVLERTGITAFDLSKVIETFVRHEETLPRELKRHLNSMEERLLESMAWEKGSSMYNSLIIARPALYAEIDRLGLLAEPMQSLDAIAMHQSPGLLPLPSQKLEASPDTNGDPRSPKRLCTENRNVLGDHNPLTPVNERLFSTPKSKMHLLQSAFASPARPNPAGGGTYADTEINVFFKKILKLVAIRIKTLCERLKCTEQFLENVYWLIQQILSQRTAVFFNRHIDQIILCSIYGVAKVTHTSLTFKEIINYYRKQPQCRLQVIRSVFVNTRNGKMGHDHVDIIRFYNEVFVPCVKSLLEVGPDGITLKNKLSEEKNDCDGQIPASPRLPPFPTLPDMSPKKVSTSHNVYVSPLRQSKKDALLSPSSKSYYACVGESTHAYQSPSNDLTAINNRLNCGRKVGNRLSFDVVSDSVVAGSLGQQNGSSASSAAAAANSLPPKSEQTDA